ncbi:hypothetical protein [Mesorhizobium sp. BHbdii]
METTLTYLHTHLELKESALAKLKPYERAKAKRPASGIPERPLRVETMLNVNNRSLVESAGEAPHTAIGKGARHSSAVSLDLRMPGPA